MNTVQGSVTLNLIFNTDLNVEDFKRKFHEGNVIDSKVVVTLSDGSVHTLDVCEILSSYVSSFLVDGEDEIIEENIHLTEKKVTPITRMTEIAI